MQTSQKVLIINGSFLLAAAMVGCGSGEEANVENATAALQALQDRLPSAQIPLASLAEGFRAASGSVEAAAPQAADGVIRLQTDSLVREIRIKGERVADSQAVRFDDNTVIYPETDPGASTTITVSPQDDETIVEALTVIHQPAAPEVYRFAVKLADSERLEMTGENTAAVVDEAGFTSTTIEAPWTVDALGRPVPYAMSVEGNDVVMTVRHQNAGFAYPIVADPAFKIDCGIINCSLYFSRSVTRRLVTPANVATVIADVCPHPICRAVALAAGVVAAKASECAGKNQCFRVRFLKSPQPVPTGLFCDNGSHCSNN